MTIEDAVLSMVCDCIPSPQESVKNGKLDKLAPDFEMNTPEFALTKQSILDCKQDGPLVIFVAKMQPFPSKLYDVMTHNTEASVDNQKLIAIARVYSGSVKLGQKIYVLGPKHTAEKPDITETEIKHLFLMMGNSFQCIQ